MRTYAARQPASGSKAVSFDSTLIVRRCGDHACEGRCGGRNEKREPSPSRWGARRETAIPAVIGNVLGSPGDALAPPVRAFMESQFGHDFSRVRVHTDARAAESARSIGALAYTLGQHVVFPAERFTPESTAGVKLLAHELTHTIQQRQAHSGAISPQIGERGDASEVEADRVASTVVRSVNGSPSPASPSPASPSPASPAQAAIVQRQSASEVATDIIEVGPIDAWRAKNLADEALKKAQTTGLPGLHNGPADAWRHAYWNCRMTAKIGASEAEIIASAHESFGGGPAIENMMDLHNNAEGRTCSGDCDVCVQSKLDKGALRIIQAGSLVPSKPTGRTPTGAAKGGGYY
jgi:hypothetical protein